VTRKRISELRDGNSGDIGEKTVQRHSEIIKLAGARDRGLK
jgi:hypothetical protein